MTGGPLSRENRTRGNPGLSRSRSRSRSRSEALRFRKSNRTRLRSAPSLAPMASDRRSGGLARRPPAPGFCVACGPCSARVRAGSQGAPLCNDPTQSSIPSGDMDAAESQLSQLAVSNTTWPESFRYVRVLTAAASRRQRASDPGRGEPDTKPGRRQKILHSLGARFVDPGRRWRQRTTWRPGHRRREIPSEAVSPVLVRCSARQKGPAIEHARRVRLLPSEIFTRLAPTPEDLFPGPATMIQEPRLYSG